MRLEIVYSDQLISHHMHTHVHYEMLYLLEGQVSMRIREKEYTAGAGDIIFLNQFEEHATRLLKSPYRRYYVLIPPHQLQAFHKDVQLLSVFRLHGGNFPYVLHTGEKKPLFDFYFSGMQRPETVAGELSRNQLTLYNADVFRSVPVNLFACYAGRSDQWVTTPEYAREQLEALADGTYYTAYLSFDEEISFTEYLAFEEKADIDYSWFPVRTEESVYFHNGHIGMSSNFSGACIEGWDDEKYPWLFLSGNDPESAVFAAHPEQNEQIMTTHLLSQLRYLSAPERETFLSFFGERSETFASAYEYIEAHGLSIYGSVFYATKDQLLKISEMDNVYGIYVQR